MNVSPEQVFSDVLNSKNEIRLNAEQIINSQKSKRFDEALDFFLVGIKSTDDKISQLAALLFKKTFLDDNDFLKNIDKNLAENLLNNVFYPLVDVNKNWKFLERIAENIAKLYLIVDLHKSFGQIVTLFGNENNIIRRFSILILELIIDLDVINEEMVNSSINEFKNLLQNGLQDTDARVQILTLKSATTLLTKIKNENLVLEFSDLTKLIINSLIYCLKNDEDGTTAKSCMETLNSLTTLHPKLWKNNLDNFLSVICEIIQSERFDKVLKQSTFQIVLSFSGSTPAYLRKCDYFKKNLIEILICMLNDVDNVDSIEDWTTYTDDNDNDFNDLHFAAREGLELFALDLGAKFFLDLINPYLTKLLGSNNWIDLHSGFTAIAWLAEPCKKQFKSILSNLLK